MISEPRTSPVAGSVAVAISYIGRDNVAKRLRTLAGSPGRAVYRDGSARFELDEGALIVTPPFGLEEEGEYDVLRVEPLLEALETKPTVGVLLVRMGGYSAAVGRGCARDPLRDRRELERVEGGRIHESSVGACRLA